MTDAVGGAGGEILAARNLFLRQLQAEQPLDEEIVGRGLQPTTTYGLVDAQCIAPMTRAAAASTTLARLDDLVQSALVLHCEDRT